MTDFSRFLTQKALWVGPGATLDHLEPSLPEMWSQGRELPEFWRQQPHRQGEDREKPRDAEGNKNLNKSWNGADQMRPLQGKPCYLNGMLACHLPPATFFSVASEWVPAWRPPVKCHTPCGVQGTVVTRPRRKNTVKWRGTVQEDQGPVGWRIGSGWGLCRTAAGTWQNTEWAQKAHRCGDTWGLCLETCASGGQQQTRRRAVREINCYP